MGHLTLIGDFLNRSQVAGCCASFPTSTHEFEELSYGNWSVHNRSHSKSRKPAFCVEVLSTNGGSLCYEFPWPLSALFQQGRIQHSLTTILALQQVGRRLNIAVSASPVMTVGQQGQQESSCIDFEFSHGIVPSARLHTITFMSERSCALVAAHLVQLTAASVSFPMPCSPSMPSCRARSPCSVKDLGRSRKRKAAVTTGLFQGETWGGSLRKTPKGQPQGSKRYRTSPGTKYILQPEAMAFNMPQHEWAQEQMEQCQMDIHS